MDSEESISESNSASMISDGPDVSDALEVTESTGLSPSTERLSLNDQECAMGIENSWSDHESTTGCLNRSNYATPDDGVIDDLPVMYGPLPEPKGQLNNISVNNSDMRDVITRGVCGLRNLGNTCFMAAGLQCLTATPPVMEHFTECQRNGEKSIPPSSLMAHFSRLIGQMWSGEYEVVHPTEFKQTLGFYHSQFKDSRQHDCQEFLALLLDSLHEQMNVAASNKPCYILNATVTTADSFKSTQNGDRESGSIITATEDNDNISNPFDDQIMTDYPTSPNSTMAGGSSREDSEIMDRRSPLNVDEETLDSDETLASGKKTDFIHNDVGDILKEPPCLDEFNDIAKDAKTSNANFLVTVQESNNESHSHSQKFSRGNIRTLTSENSNLTENHNFDNKSVSVKRTKEVNVQKNHATSDYCISNGIETEYDSGLDVKCNVKKMRLEDQEKNHRREGLSSIEIPCSRSQNHENGAIESQNEADKHWNKHLKLNKSIIVDTFQGQFKSTVNCEHCGHVSVTYEPFMYLSVPLPHAMEKQMTVMYIPANGDQPIECIVSLNKQSKVAKLKEELLKTLNKEDIPVSRITVAEVHKQHISKIIESNTLLRCIDTTNRSLYAFEMMDPPKPYSQESNDSDQDQNGHISVLENGVASSTDNNGCCTICLEEQNQNFKKHDAPNCTFIICNGECLETLWKREDDKGRKVCPICNVEMTDESFIKVDRPVSTVKILNVPLILRYDTDEATNNRKRSKLFGYPHLLKLPSEINAEGLADIVKQVAPDAGTYTLHFVDAMGIRCSRCTFKEHCSGCKIPESGLVTFTNNDTLAVRYSDSVPSDQKVIKHKSCKNPRPHKRLSLYDCLEAFSQRETLDENNPWFCPKCERNQCATKKLTVHRYPKYLIVYLKRFVFYECVSMKLDDRVNFPLVGLKCGGHQYDLYACVCHFGGVSAGHYTAYAKNKQLDSWHYYNDDITCKQKPQDEDFSNAYILFYSQQEEMNNIKHCNR